MKPEMRALLRAEVAEQLAACRAGTCTCAHRPGGRCIRYVPTEADRARARLAWRLAP